MCLKEIKRLDKVGSHDEQIKKVIRLLLKSSKGEMECQEAIGLLKGSKEL